jgi:hypothetical protein
MNRYLCIKGDMNMIFEGKNIKNILQERLREYMVTIVLFS